MTPHQMIEFLALQCKQAARELTSARDSARIDLIEVKQREVRTQLEFLKGYATAMEHAGLMEKEHADHFFASFNHL